MNHLNSILIEGNLTADPVFKTTPKGTALCTLSLASERYYRQPGTNETEKEVGFFDVTAWAAIAERCRDMGHKGRGVRVVGRLKQDRWTGPDGKAHSRVSIVAEHIEFRPEFKPAETASAAAPAAAVETPAAEVAF